MTRWEYAGRLFNDNMNDAQKAWMIGKLCEMGERGWELVGIHDAQAIFKRPAPRQLDAILERMERAENQPRNSI